MLSIHNTMTGKKEKFKQISPDGVRMYVCGVTVYDLCHIGHARSAVVFDVIRRTLAWLDMKVIFVKNFTDIDDKIINKAIQTGKHWKEITEYYIQQHNNDMEALGVQPPTFTPKATDYINEIINFCDRLIDAGHAYVSGGDVYFRVSSFQDYGKLSNRKTEDLLSGIRVPLNDAKQSPLDFALWKHSKPEEPSWESPWGPGRPGWHIECSVMSETILGVPIDIHGGGHDLIFPHHENEIAQSESLCGCELSRFWVHNGFVNVDNEKMSKSLGNFHTIQDILKHYKPEVLRFFLLTTHYRQPLEFSDSKLKEAQAALGRINNFKAELEYVQPGDKDCFSRVSTLKIDFDANFSASLYDDINTPGALASFFEAIKQANKILVDKPNEESLNHLKKVMSDIYAVVDKVLYLFLDKTAQSNSINNTTISEQQINDLISERNQARANKDFALADKIRNDLLALGVELIDTPQKTRFKYKS